jgi:hypothetical protein
MSLRRSPRLAAKAAAAKPFVSQQGKALEYAFNLPRVPVAPAPAPAPVAAAAHPICTMAAHEASCAYCREHPEWRQIKNNLGLMFAPFQNEAIYGKAARAAAALAVMTYISEVAVGFARAHKKLMDTVIDRCQHFIDNGDEYPILRMVCSDLIRKVTM